MKKRLMLTVLSFIMLVGGFIAVPTPVEATPADGEITITPFCNLPPIDKRDN